MLIVKADRECLHATILLFVSVAIASILFYVAFQDVVFSIVFFLLLTIPCLRQWIALGRTLCFHEKGITISFLNIKKTYAWETLKTKRVVNYAGKLGYRDEHTKGAEFFPNRVLKPTILKGAEYGMLFHPFAFVFVYFRKERYSKASRMYPRYYVVDEKEFLEHLQSWGIFQSGDGSFQYERQGTVL